MAKRAPTDARERIDPAIITGSLYSFAIYAPFSGT